MKKYLYFMILTTAITLLGGCGSEEACGFKKYKHDNGILELLITKEGNAQ